MRRLLLGGLLFLAAAAPCLADPQMPDGRKIEAVRSGDGHYRVLLDGKQIYAGDAEFPVIKAIVSGGGHIYVVIEEGSGGTACPVNYRALDVSAPDPVVSKAMGSCSDLAKITVVGGVLHVATPRFGSAGGRDETFSGVGKSGAAAVGQSDMNASAEQFVRGLYAAYTDNATSGPDNRSDAMFTPGMAALLDRDAKSNNRKLDFDPICQCQDWDKLRVRYVLVNPRKPSGVAAAVTFDNGDTREVVTFDLVASNGTWRIDDIHSRDMPSLKQALRH